MPVQVNGKVRGRADGAGRLRRGRAPRARRSPTRAVAAHIAGKTVGKVIVAKGKLVSIVVR